MTDEEPVEQQPTPVQPTPVPSEEEIAAELRAAEAGEPPVSSEPSDASDASDPEDGEPPGEGEDLDERRYPSTIGGAFYLLILAATGVAIAIVWSGDWRLGIRVLAGALCFAALLRLVLPARDAGMLAVRHRLFDCVLLGGVGGALFFLTATIPNQPG